ncbi:hypothetical protein QBC35DRAFT_463879 [Podospora australis]|uniref:Uncharacterized protein n=1 Tax=Podospora australis TaxID=1536484 RepID=A0AAN7AIX9_9PEZI|nr:hypothetical protein QBC35DRAFT_463879 [Podospora australis]
MAENSSSNLILSPQKPDDDKKFNFYDAILLAEKNASTSPSPKSDIPPPAPPKNLKRPAEALAEQEGPPKTLITTLDSVFDSGCGMQAGGLSCGAQHEKSWIFCPGCYKTVCEECSPLKRFYCRKYPGCDGRAFYCDECYDHERENDRVEVRVESCGKCGEKRMDFEGWDGDGGSEEVDEVVDGEEEDAENDAVGGAAAVAEDAVVEGGDDAVVSLAVDATPAEDMWEETDVAPPRETETAEGQIETARDEQKVEETVAAAADIAKSPAPASRSPLPDSHSHSIEDQTEVEARRTAQKRNRELTFAPIPSTWPEPAQRLVKQAVGSLDASLDPAGQNVWEYGMAAPLYFKKLPSWVAIQAIRYTYTELISRLEERLALYGIEWMAARDGDEFIFRVNDDGTCSVRHSKENKQGWVPVQAIKKPEMPRHFTFLSSTLPAPPVCKYADGLRHSEECGGRQCERCGTNVCFECATYLLFHAGCYDIEAYCNYCLEKYQWTLETETCRKCKVLGSNLRPISNFYNRPPCMDKHPAKYEPGTLRRNTDKCTTCQEVVCTERAVYYSCHREGCEDGGEIHCKLCLAESHSDAANCLGCGEENFVVSPKDFVVDHPADNSEMPAACSVEEEKDGGDVTG